MKDLKDTALNQVETTDVKAHGEWEGSFELVEFADVPEPMVAAHIPMQED